MDPFDAAAMAAAYDVVAEDYAAAFADDLARLDVDRAVLDAFTSASGKRCPTSNPSTRISLVARRTAS